MITFKNENILKTIFKTYTLLDTRHQSIKIQNKLIFDILTKYLNNSAIFKSMGKSFHILSGHISFVTSLALLPDGNIVSGSDNTTLKIWDVNTNECKKTILGHQCNIKSVITLPDDKIVSCSVDGNIKIWDINDDFKCLRTINLPGFTMFNQLVLLSNGNIACTAIKHFETYILVFDRQVDFRSIIKTIKAQTISDNYTVILSGDKFASTGQGYSINIYDVDNGYECVKVIKGHASVISALLFIIGKDLLISATYNGYINIWKISDDYQCIKTIDACRKGLTCLLYLGNLYFACGFNDKTIKIWDLKDYKCVNTFQGHRLGITSLIMLKCKRIASASLDGTVIIYNY
jgi:WD40 repeat protein